MTTTVATGTVTLISRLPGGANIPQDPASPNSGEFIRFPAVSTDGSHILMSTASSTSAIHIYMSIDDAPAIAIAGGEAVDYVGMTPRRLQGLLHLRPAAGLRR